MVTVVVVPQVVCHNLDPHTGIPFMPHIAAHMAGALRHAGFGVEVYDCFGMDPHTRQVVGEFMLMGTDEDTVVSHMSPEVKICYIYCRAIAEFIAIERFIKVLSTRRPDIAIVLFENVQSVTSYSLKPIAHEFLAKGADAIILGEPETRAEDITKALLAGRALRDIPGVAFRDSDGACVITDDDAFVKDLDSLPMTGWNLFPLDGYWKAGFAHAPCGDRRFLPLLTSRGCPYRCRFCIAPSVNPIWRARSAKHVVDEMEHYWRTLDITDFHISDLDPTVSDKRTQEICREIIRRKLPITWKLAQGTKIETIKSEKTLELMAESGCVFVSFSPESGSERLLKIMNKPFDHEYALKMARKMSELGIKMQAVFIGGVPGETPDDQDQSIRYAKRLISAGVDEVSLVIFAPLPGADMSKLVTGYRHYSQCTPSPNWRADYRQLTRYRRRMYAQLFAHRFSNPRKILTTALSLLNRKFETKMEMSLFKQLKLYLLRYAPWVFYRAGTSH